MCHHVSGMEHLAYYLRILWEVCLAQMSGKWHGHSLRPTWCKRGRGTATTPGNLSIAMVSHTTLAKNDIRPIVNLCNGM
jgi:hypothetical protein